MDILGAKLGMMPDVDYIFNEVLHNDIEPFLIYVDLDDTLACVKNYKNVDDRNKEGEFIYKGRKVKTALRPYAEQFLIALSEFAPTFIMTLGFTDFQKRVVQSLGIDVLVEDIFGPDRYQEVRKSKNAVLFDDLESLSGGIELKLDAAGIDSDRHIQVQKWDGSYEDDELYIITSYLSG